MLLVLSRTHEIGNKVREDSEASVGMSQSFYLGRAINIIKEQSQQGGSIDFVDQFKNGSIYKIGGTYYNSHEALNFLWGSALERLGVPSYIAVEAAKYYHRSAYERDVKLGEMNKYQRVGPDNEPNHNKAIRSGSSLFK